MIYLNEVTTRGVVSPSFGIAGRRNRFFRHGNALLVKAFRPTTLLHGPGGGPTTLSSFLTLQSGVGRVYREAC